MSNAPSMMSFDESPPDTEVGPGSQYDGSPGGSEAGTIRADFGGPTSDNGRPHPATLHFGPPPSHLSIAPPAYCAPGPRIAPLRSGAAASTGGSDAAFVRSTGPSSAVHDEGFRTRMAEPPTQSDDAPPAHPAAHGSTSSHPTKSGGKPSKSSEAAPTRRGLDAAGWRDSSKTPLGTLAADLAISRQSSGLLSKGKEKIARQSRSGRTGSSGHVIGWRRERCKEK